MYIPHGYKHCLSRHLITESIPNFYVPSEATAGYGWIHIFMISYDIYIDNPDNN
jgi:hypothetical protein